MELLESADAFAAAAGARQYRGVAEQRAVWLVVRRGEFLAGVAQWAHRVLNSGAAAAQAGALANPERPSRRRRTVPTAKAPDRAKPHESEAWSPPAPPAYEPVQEQS